MSYNPYKSLSDHAFWKTGVEKSEITFPDKIYKPRWKIDGTDKIATMGSCFAQHIAKWLRENGFNAPFYETEGFNETEPMFSANYGNVYTVRQALQLIQESVGDRTPSEVAWAKDDKFIDGIRPNSIKDGFKTAEEVLNARKLHLGAVQKMVKDFDVLIFTLGLTEAWEIKSCGTIIPTAPGILGGTFDPERYQFLNFKYNEIMDDLCSLHTLLKTIRNDKPFRMMLTVSPVPLTATATDQHILLATTYSKSVLRSVAGDFAGDNDFAEYFPSFEIINNPAARSEFFESNLRSVKMSAVGNVMNVFSSTALVNSQSEDKENPEAFEPDCEDALLEEFVPAATWVNDIGAVCVGDSHLAGFRSTMTDESIKHNKKETYFFPVNWGKHDWRDFDSNKYLTNITIKDEYKHLIADASIQDMDTLVLVGLRLAGDDIVRCSGSLGREFSPQVSIKTKVDENLVDFYKPFVYKKLSPMIQFDAHTRYKKVFWVAGADMCVSTARFRFGAEFVDSGSYLIHKEAYMTAVHDCTINFKKIQLIFHDDNLCDPDNGFTLDKYRWSDSLWDIHGSHDYYKSSVAKIFAN